MDDNEVTHSTLMWALALLGAAVTGSSGFFLSQILGIKGDHVKRDEFAAVQKDYVGRAEFETQRGRFNKMTDKLAGIEARQLDDRRALDEILRRIAALETRHNAGTG